MSRWKRELPTEILELVLARLPAHVLCRFRVVCKRWNHLITQHGFASLRAQVPRRASSVVITSKARYINPMWADEVGKNSEDSCEILDMSEKRFYALSDSFLLDYLDQRFQCAHWIKHTLASDGELVYVMCSTPGDRAHIICNPMTKKFHHVIPEPNILFTDMVVMSADNATGSYRIVAIHGGINSSGRGRVYLYDSDSNTLGWRKICEGPGVGFSKSLQTGSCILLKGMLYTLLMNISMAPWRPQLNSCDLETGECVEIRFIPNPVYKLFIQ